MKYNNNARTFDLLFGGLAILSAVIMTGLLIFAAIVHSLGGTFTAIFNISLMGLLSAVGSALQQILFACIFAIVWIIVGVRAIIRAERSKIYARKLGEYYSRLKLSHLVNDMNKTLKEVSTDLNVMKKRGYFPNMSFDLENKEIVCSGSSEPLVTIGDEAQTVYTRHTGFPVMAIVAGIFTLLAFGIGIWGAIVGVGAFLLTFVFFPIPVYFSETKRETPKIKKPATTGNDSLDDVLGSIFDNKKELVRLSGQITSPKIREPLKEILRILDLISEFIADNPDKVRALRQFTNYYLPTTVNFLQTYDELEKKTAKGDNIIATLNKIEEVTAKLVDVYKREYDDLFSDKVMDIEAEAAVMKSIIKEGESAL
jgi:ABC-type multidrug transport system fused ATPase/permease subunit